MLIIAGPEKASITRGTTITLVRETEGGRKNQLTTKKEIAVRGAKPSLKNEAGTKKRLLRE